MCICVCYIYIYVYTGVYGENNTMVLARNRKPSPHTFTANTNKRIFWTFD